MHAAIARARTDDLQH